MVRGWAELAVICNSTLKTSHHVEHFCNSLPSSSCKDIFAPTFLNFFFFQRGCEQKREYNYFWRALMIINQMTKIWFRTSNFLRNDSLLVAWWEGGGLWYNFFGVGDHILFRGNWGGTVVANRAYKSRSVENWLLITCQRGGSLEYRSASFGVSCNYYHWTKQHLSCFVEYLLIIILLVLILFYFILFFTIKRTQELYYILDFCFSIFRVW